MECQEVYINIFLYNTKKRKHNAENAVLLVKAESIIIQKKLNFYDLKKIKKEKTEMTLSTVRRTCILSPPPFFLIFLLSSN